MNCCGTKGTSRDTGVNMEVLHPVPADKSNPTDTPTSKRASNSGPVDINPQTLPSPMSTHEGGDGATGKLTSHSSNTYNNTNDMCIRASIDKYQSPDTVSLIPYKEPHTSEGRSVSLTTSLLPPPSPVGGGIPTQARRPPPAKAPSRTASRIATPRGRYNHTVHVAGDPKNNIANICGSSLTIPLKRCQDENRDNIVTIHVQSNSRDTAGDTDTNNNIHIDRASVGMYGAADVSTRDDDAMCGLGPTPPATAPSPASVRASSIGGREVYDKQKYGRSNEHNNNNTDDSADISRYSGIMPHSSAILSGDSSIVCSGVYVESKYSDNLCVHHSGYGDNIGKSSNASVAGEPATADMPKGRCINAPLFDVNNSNYITPIVRIGDAAPSRVECLSCPPQALRSQHHYSPTYLSTKAACVPGEYVMSSRKHTGHNYITPKRCLAAPLVTETDMLMSTLPNRLENNNSNNNNLNSNNGSPYLYRTEPSGSDGIPITSIPLCMDSAQGYGRSKGDPHRARVHETIYTPTPIPPHVTYSSPAGQSRATGNAPVLIAHTITDCNGIPIDPQSHSISQISPYRDPPMPTQLPAPGSSAKKANKVTKATYFLPSMALSCGGSASRRERSDLRTVNISISQEGSSGSPPMSVVGRGHRSNGNHPSHVYSRPPGDGNSNCPTSPYQTIEVEVDDVDEDKYFNNNNIVNNNVNNNMNNNKVDHHGNGTSNRVPTYGAATNIEYAYNMLSSTGGFTNINATQQAQHNPMEHTFQYRNTLQSGNPGTSLPTPIPPPMSKWGEGHKTTITPNVCAHTSVSKMPSPETARHDSIPARASVYQEWDSSLTSYFPHTTPDSSPVGVPADCMPTLTTAANAQAPTWKAPPVPNNQEADHMKKRAAVRQALMSGGIFGSCDSESGDGSTRQSLNTPVQQPRGTHILKRLCSAIAPFMESIVSQLSHADRELRGALRVRDVLVVLNSYLGEGSGKRNNNSSGNGLVTGLFTASDIKQLLLIAEGAATYDTIYSDDSPIALDVVLPYASLVSGIMDLNSRQLCQNSSL